MSEIITDVIEFIPTTTKDMLLDSTFKSNITMNISTALSTLEQNGLGSLNVSLFDNDKLDWDDFFIKGLSESGRSQAKQYVFTQVQLVFDTPQGSIVSILEKSAEQSLWRARLEAESIEE